MTGRHLWAILLALVAAATAGCSGNAPDDPPSPTTTSTSSSTSTSLSTTPAPTPEEVAASDALAVVEGYWRVIEQSQQAPAAQDWEPALRQYADEVATAPWLASVQFALEGGLRQDGENTIQPAVTSVDLAADPQPTVMVMACYDSTEARTVYAETGEPTGLDPEPEIPRWELRVTVLQYPEQEGSPWLVHDSEALTDQPC